MPRRDRLEAYPTLGFLALYLTGLQVSLGIVVVLGL
jgi:hypothetical protein